MKCACGTSLGGAPHSAGRRSEATLELTLALEGSDYRVRGPLVELHDRLARVTQEGTAMEKRSSGSLAPDRFARLIDFEQLSSQSEFHSPEVC